jgi:hypothetical protein
MSQIERMAGEDKFRVCERCKTGKVIKSMEAMNFTHASNKGYVRCRATISVAMCHHCGTRSLDQGVDKILDEAFQREYNKLP